MAEGKAEILSGYLGVGIYTEGTLRASGVVRIDGGHSGVLEAAGGAISVGPTAKVRVSEGTVGSAIIQGSLEGSLCVREGLELDGTGRVVGEIVAGWLEVEEGGILEGSIRVGDSGEDPNAP